MSEEICELSDLPVEQCACKIHAPDEDVSPQQEITFIGLPIDLTKPMRMDRALYLLFEVLTAAMPTKGLVSEEFVSGYRGARDLVLHLAVKIHETILEKEAQSNV